MNTDLKYPLENIINQFDEIKGLYTVMMDCIRYHVAGTCRCENIFPLSTIIETKINNLFKDIDDVYLKINGE